MFPNYSDTNISLFSFIFTILLNKHVSKCGKMIGGNFKTIDFRYMVWIYGSIWYGFMDPFFLAEPINLSEVETKDTFNKNRKKFRKYQLVP